MKKMMMSLKSSRMILHIGEKPIFCVGISSASWAGVVAKLEEEEYDVGLQMEFSLPKSRHNTMCDFHNFGLIFAGQCTVCLKG